MTAISANQLLPAHLTPEIHPLLSRASGVGPNRMQVWLPSGSPALKVKATQFFTGRHFAAHSLMLRTVQ